jgi:hypothetical protein
MDAARRNAMKSKEDESEKPANILESFRQKYANKAIMGRRSKKGSDNDVMDRLEVFRTKMNQTKKDTTSNSKTWVCELHSVENCKSCRR